MRFAPSAPRPRRAVRPLALALLGTVLAACGGDSSGPGQETVAALQVQSGNQQSGTVGELLRDSLAVRVTDSQARGMAGVAVSWLVESGGGSVTTTSTTDAGGTAKAAWRLGTTSGPAAVRATAGSQSATFTATATPGAVSAVTLTPATLTLDPGATRQLQPAAADAYGNLVAGRTYTWSSNASHIASVDGSGVVRGVAGGVVQIRATTDGKFGEATITVTGPPPQLPSISAITPELLEPGTTATLTGTNFSATAAANTVTIAGKPASVTAASATQLQVTVPSLAALGCLPAGTADVVVSVGGNSARRPHALRTASTRTLAVGQMLPTLSAAAFGCAEFAAASGRYLIAVYNAGPANLSGGLVGAGVGVRMLSSGPPTASPAEPPSLMPRALAAGLPAGLATRLERAARLRRTHTLELAQRESLAAQLRQRAAATPSAAKLQASLVVLQPNVGDTVWMRYPNPQQPSCTVLDSIRARVAHIGTRSIILEDLAAPLAGQVDEKYAQMAAVFDTSQYPVVRDNFGDPLALDAELNADGRLYMLFTQRVNDYGAAGFVWPGDVYPRSVCPQSNVAEVFYGMVPKVATGGTAADAISDWYWLTRATVVHEVKHIASTVARLKNGSGGEARWLEEATAMVAEELWARRLFGYAQRGNVDFMQSIACEFGQGPGCADRPLVMTNHFGWLYDYLELPEAHSVLGSTVTGDNTYYGSSWAFLRWALDQSSTSEAALLRAINSATSSGVTSLTTVVGRPYEELLREFTTALAVDDWAGLTGVDARLTMPSWNLRNVYEGMHLYLRNSSGQPAFPLPYPLVPRLMGTTAIDVTEVRPGSAVFFDLQVPATAARAFQAVAPPAGQLSPDLRVLVIRVQ